MHLNELEYLLMLSLLNNELQTLSNFLRIPTPMEWIQSACQQIPLLLLDHAHCERKAAATAINFISKYPEYPALVAIMAPLAREELLHFEKVLDLMQHRGVAFGPLQPSGYAQRLHQAVSIKNGKERLCEQLLIGAIIEARSCERFSALVPHLQDEGLKKFYASLVKAEARHFQDYIQLAEALSVETSSRLEKLLDIENALITAQEDVFRFHSGIPVLSTLNNNTLSYRSQSGQ